MSVRRKPSLADMIRERRMDNKWTPDILEREKYAYVPLFVYGCQQKNQSDEKSLLGFPLVGRGYTYGDSYVMYVTPDHEPVVFSQPTHNQSAKVYGELYVVPPEVLYLLDDQHCLGTHFHRRWELILYKKPGDLLNDKAQVYSSDAIMYTGNSSDPQMKGWLNQIKTLPHHRYHDGDHRFYRWTMFNDRENRILPDTDRDTIHTHLM